MLALHASLCLSAQLRVRDSGPVNPKRKLEQRMPECVHVCVVCVYLYVGVYIYAWNAPVCLYARVGVGMSMHVCLFVCCLCMSVCVNLVPMHMHLCFCACLDSGLGWMGIVLGSFVNASLELVCLRSCERTCVPNSYLSDQPWYVHARLHEICRKYPRA